MLARLRKNLSATLPEDVDEEGEAEKEIETDDPDEMKVLLRNATEEVEEVDLMLRLRGEGVDPQVKAELKAKQEAHNAREWSRLQADVPGISEVDAKEMLKRTASHDGTRTLISSSSALSVTRRSSLASSSGSDSALGFVIAASKSSSAS